MKSLPKIVMILCLILQVDPLLALDSDQQQPLYIDADKMTIDENKGFSHYQGNVHMTQGSLKIKADDVVIWLDNGVIQKIIITGQPASLEQLPDNNEAPIHSLAQRMEYYATMNRLILLNDAKVWQGQNQFSGNRIEYNTADSTVTASNNDNDEGRVRAVITPKPANNSSQ